MSVLRQANLPEKRRRDLASAISAAEKLLHRNLWELPADMTTLRERLAPIHHVQAGVSAKRLANIKSDLATALRISIVSAFRRGRKSSVATHGRSSSILWKRLGSAICSVGWRIVVRQSAWRRRPWTIRSSSSSAVISPTAALPKTRTRPGSGQFNLERHRQAGWPAVGNSFCSQEGSVSGDPALELPAVFSGRC